VDTGERPKEAEGERVAESPGRALAQVVVIERPGLLERAVDKAAELLKPPSAELDPEKRIQALRLKTWQTQYYTAIGVGVLVLFALIRSIFARRY
jgi:hypothetical protein